jgi:hypothetical protein
MTSDNRRKYSRLTFQSPVKLTVYDQHLEGTLIDISLKGALIQLKPDTVLETGVTGTLYVNLNEKEREIAIEVLVVHAKDGRVGASYLSIDLDSVTDLYRLVELNLGSSELLGREISAMIVD